jgi:transcriptional regulator
MHPSPAFRMADTAAMRAFVAGRGFAHIFCATPDGPMVAHAPVVVEGDAIRFHLARTNRLARHLDGATALASIAGPDAYISPDWYGTADQVPTWNYVAVEAQGPVRRLDRTELVAQLDALSAAHEATLAPKPLWTREKMTPGRFEAMLPALAGFELRVTAWRGTAKLSQNKSAAERAGMAAGLANVGRVDMLGLLNPP